VVRFYPNRFVATLMISALTVTWGLTPAVTRASTVNPKVPDAVQSLKSSVNTLTRLGGEDRYSTAVQIAEQGWKSASMAVLAPSSDLNMVDTLVSSSLAKAVDGPILLADMDSIPSMTMTELKKLGVTQVYLVSGTGYLSAKVEKELAAAGIQSIRLGTHDRYETALNIAKEIQKIKPFQEVVVTNSTATVDAISIAPIAAAKGIPILLVDKNTVPKAVSDFINASDIKKTYVIGGTAVITDKVKKALPLATRLGGKDRFDTNLQVLKQFENQVAGGGMFFANGDDTSLIDSLIGAPMVAKAGGAIILANKGTVPTATQDFIQAEIALKNPGILGIILDSTVQGLMYDQPDEHTTQIGAVEFNQPYQTLENKTVTGNLLVDADGVTLQNVKVKGTLFIDPGKFGSTQLDVVEATRIVVLSGADHNSIHLRETKSPSLVVSSSSNVHVVAETGTILGSTLVQTNATVESQDGANIGTLSVRPCLNGPINVQLQGTFSREVVLSGRVKLSVGIGATVANVQVTESDTPDLVQLVGLFPSVTIRDNSSFTLDWGRIDKLNTAGSGYIVVEKGTEIRNFKSSTGAMRFSGGGIVNDNMTDEDKSGWGDNPPTFTSATITGAAKVGQVLTASGIGYSDSESDKAGTPLYQWMIGSTVEGPYANIVGATRMTYTPLLKDLQKYLKVKVTPVALTGTGRGTPVISAATLAVVEDENTIAGQLTVSRQGGANNLNPQTILTYTLGEDYTNGLVMFSLPGGITVSVGDEVRIDKAESYRISADKISEDSRQVTIGLINAKKGASVVLTLKRDIQVGSWEFNAEGDKDGSGPKGWSNKTIAKVNKMR